MILCDNVTCDVRHTCLRYLKVPKDLQTYQTWSKSKGFMDCPGFRQVMPKDKEQLKVRTLKEADTYNGAYFKPAESLQLELFDDDR